MLLYNNILRKNKKRSTLLRFVLKNNSKILYYFFNYNVGNYLRNTVKYQIFVCCAIQMYVYHGTTIIIAISGMGYSTGKER